MHPLTSFKCVSEASEHVVLPRLSTVPSTKRSTQYTFIEE